MCPSSSASLGFRCARGTPQRSAPSRDGRGAVEAHSERDALQAATGPAAAAVGWVPGRPRDIFKLLRHHCKSNRAQVRWGPGGRCGWVRDITLLRVMSPLHGMCRWTSCSLAAASCQSARCAGARCGPPCAAGLGVRVSDELFVAFRCPASAAPPGCQVAAGQPPGRAAAVGPRGAAACGGALLLPSNARSTPQASAHNVSHTSAECDWQMSPRCWMPTPTAFCLERNLMAG
jgi:hypothetical protein